MESHHLDIVLLGGSAVLILAVFAVRLSTRLGMPSLLMYLALGLLTGHDGLGVEFNDSSLALAVGMGALILILAEGGLTTDWTMMRPALSLGLLLAVLGTTVSVAIVAVGTHFLLGLHWQLALLLAAVLSPTDAAAVFSVLRLVPLEHRISGALEAESGLNDAPIVVLVVAISAGNITHEGPVGFVALVVFELLAGAAIGAVLGFVGARSLRAVALPAAGLYPLVVFAFTVLSYAVAAQLHASGFAAVYVAALVLGNTDLPHRSATRSFVEGIGLLAQIGLFVMLGLLANPDEFTWWHVGVGLAAGAMLTFVARPVSVAACATWFGVPWREQLFIGWAGLRGAVPIVLSTIPLAAGVPGSRDLFNIVFVAVVVYTLLQAAPLPQLAAWCGVLSDGARHIDIDAAPLERINADLLQVRVPTDSRLRGVEIRELRLPTKTSVSMIVRDEESFVPTPTTRLRVDDELLIVAPRHERDAAERRLRAIGEGGRLAGWEQ